MVMVSGTLFAASLINAPAPLFSMTDTNGEKVSLKSLTGNIVVLEWKNHLCPFVQAHYDSGNMQKLQKKYKDKSVVWISVVSSAKGKQGYVDNKKANNIALKEKSAAHHILLDKNGKMSKMYRAKTTPHMYVIDAEGVLVYAGAIDDNPRPFYGKEKIAKAKNYVVKAVDALLEGDPVAVQQTKPYGCSIKL